MPGIVILVAQCVRNNHSESFVEFFPGHQPPVVGNPNSIITSNRFPLFNIFIYWDLTSKADVGDSSSSCLCTKEITLPMVECIVQLKLRICFK